MEKFFETVRNVSDEFKTLCMNKVVRIVGNSDTDGITGCSILVKAFNRKNIKFALSFFKQLNSDILNDLKLENYETIIFVDFGSSYIEEIEKKLDNKIIFILDHHKPKKTITNANIFHLNPHLFNIDGTKDVSASGVAYFFAREIDKENIDLSHLALIGAIGDVQEKNGFYGLNKIIFEDALKSRLITVKEGYRFYGVYSKPIHKTLQYTTNPYIPGVTGDEFGAIRFLEKLNINPKSKDSYRYFNDLSYEEKERLVKAIFKDKKIIGNIYFLKSNENYDFTELSTLINCCGRLNKPSLGLGVCINDKKSIEKANALLEEYTNEIIDAFNWFYFNKENKKLIEKNGFIVINAEDKIRDSIIGVLVSTLSKTNIYNDGTVLIGLAYTLDNNVKVSLRVCGESRSDLIKLIADAVDKSGGNFGGHDLAAGALIPLGKEDIFINSILESAHLQVK